MSDDDLHARVVLALAEADEICRRGGPVSYISLLMSVAADRAEYAHGCGYFGYIEEDIKKIEKEAENAGRTDEITKVLIRGYEEIAARCNKKYEAGYREHYLIFANKCNKRIKELSSR